MPTFDELISPKASTDTPAATGTIDSLLGPPAGLRRNSGTAGDLWTSVKKGVEELPGMATGVLDIVPALVGGIRPFSKGADLVGEATGFQPGKWAQDLNQEYSPKQVQAQADIEKVWQDPAKTGSDVAMEYLKNPSYIANLVAESTPSTLAGGVISKGLMGVGRVALPAVDGVVAKGAGALERKLGLEGAAAVAGGAGEGTVQAGQQMDQYQGTDQRKNAIAALGSGVIDAVIAAGAGRLAQSMGLETADTLMAKGFNRSVEKELALGKKALGTVGRIAGGAASEGILQEFPQSAQEQMFQNYADGKPIWESVPRQAIEGALAGAVMGAGANVVGPKTKPVDNHIAEQTILNMAPEGSQVKVEGDNATVIVPNASGGEMSIETDIDTMVKHFAAGGTFDTLRNAKGVNVEGLAAEKETPPAAPATEATPQVSPERGSQVATFQKLLNEEMAKSNPDPVYVQDLQTAIQGAQNANAQGTATGSQTAQGPVDTTQGVAAGTAAGTQEGVRPSAVGVDQGVQIGQQSQVPTGVAPNLTENMNAAAGIDQATSKFPAESQLVAGVRPDLTYVGAEKGTHNINVNEGPAKGATFAVKGKLTVAKVQTSLTKIERPFLEAAQRQKDLANAIPSGPTFATQSGAKQHMMKNGIEGHIVVPVKGGFALAPKQAPLNSVAETPETQRVHSELKTFLGQGYANLTKKGKVVVVQGIPDLPDGGSPIYSKGLKVAGRYYQDTKKVYLVADNIKPGDAEYVMRHEAVHALLREDAKFMKDREKILSDFASLRFSDPTVDAAFVRAEKNAKGDIVTEEALAYWMQTAANHTHSLYKRIISAVKAALYRLGIAHGRYTTTDLSRMFTEGTKTWAAGEQGGNVNEFARGVLTSLVEAKRIIQNLPAFKVWFSGSQIVDATGNPLTMFHGTTNNSITKFVPHVRRGEQFGFGIHLTEDPEFASRYADKELQGRTKGPGNVIPTFVSAKNVLNADKIVHEGSKEYALAYALAGKLRPQMFQQWYDDRMHPAGKAVYLQNAIDAASGGVAEKIIRAAGYDGIWYESTIRSQPFNGAQNVGSKARSLVVFDPTQIKSIFNRKWDRSNPDILMSVAERAKALYSHLAKIGLTKFEGMKAQGVENFLLKHGVKKVEIAATGLKEWLAGMKPTDKVSKEDLKGFVKANMVKTEDVVLGGNKGQEQQAFADKAAREYGHDSDRWPQHVWDKWTELGSKEAPAQTHFDQYTEPGSKEGSYREMFVTAEAKPMRDTTDLWEKMKSGLKNDGYLGFDSASEAWNAIKRDNDWQNRWEPSAETVQAIEEYKAAYEEKSNSRWSDGHSQYQDIKNPIVRIRFNEVTDTGGRRILRIEEMQGPSDANQQNMPKYLKDNIYQMGVKRIIAYAKENGFDGVALSTRPGMTAGETQADRYSLEKHISELHYSGTNLKAYDHNGDTVINQIGVQEKDLPGIVGKEVARKLLEQPKQGTLRSLVGEDIKVGGEGLKSLYDQTLPKMLEAYGGGKMGETSTGLSDEDTKNTIAQQIFHRDFNELFPGQQTDVMNHMEKRGQDVSGKTTMPYLPITEKTPSEFPMFSIADDALKFGMNKVNAAVAAMSDPKAKMHDLVVKYAPKWLSVTPLHTLVKLFGGEIPQVVDFSKHLTATDFTRTEIVDTSAVYHEKALELAKDTVGVDVFNKAAATASYNRMTPWKSLLEQDWVPKDGTPEERIKAANKAWASAGMRKATSLTFSQAHAEAVAAYDALKGDDLKEAYAKIVEHLSNIRQREENNLLALIEASSEEGSDLRNNLMNRFHLSFRNLQGAYWPLARFGDYTVDYMDKDGVRHYIHTETIDQANEIEKAALADGADLETMVRAFKEKTPGNISALPQKVMSQLSEAVEKTFMAGVDQNDAAAVTSAEGRIANTLEDMNQIFLRWQPETSALKNSMKRGNVKGFADDMLRSYLEYMQRHAGNIAWTEQGRKIEATIQSLADDIHEKKKLKEGRVDLTMDVHILNDLRNRIQALRTASVGSFTSLLGKLGTAYYMTSPSIALVQMSQLAVLTMPKLSVMFNPIRAAKAMGEATKLAFTKDFTREAMFADPVVNHVYDNMHAVVTQQTRAEKITGNRQLGDPLFTPDEILTQVEKLTPYQKQLLVLRESMARNLLDISAAHEAFEVARGGDPNSLRSKVFRYAMMPMSLSELTSRKTAILATWELTQQGEGTDFFKSMDRIAEVVDDTLFSYSKTNKGSALQGGTARLLLQFQHYRIMTGIRMAMLLHDSIRGESKEVKRAALKEFTGIMGMTGALAGTLGLPMSGMMFSILSAVFGDSDEPKDYQLMFEEWLNETFGATAANVAARGLPTLVGADLSRRLGLADIYGVQNDPPSNLHGKALAAWWAANQLGPVFSVGQSWVQGYDEMINKGNYMKGLEAATPKPIKDVLKSIRYATEGVKNSQGRKILGDDNVGGNDILMQALGFSPAEIARAQGYEHSLTNLTTTIAERRGRLISDAAKAITSGDDTSDVLSSIRTFNSRMPEFGIKGSDIRPAVRKIITGEVGMTGIRQRRIAAKYEIPVYRQ